METEETPGVVAPQPPAVPASDARPASPPEPDRGLEARTLQILRKRAKVLSQPRSVAGATPTVELVVFSLGSERFGVEVSAAREVLPLPPIVPVPHTPPWVVGVAGYRGRVLTVVDLRPLLQLPAEAETGGQARLVVVESCGMVFGLRAGALHGVFQAEDALIAAPGPRQEGGLRFVRGVTPERVAVLDLPALAQHPGFQVKG
ncbi:MAG: chemotaxis protein CheW [Armatimonadota bacterium]